MSTFIELFREAETLKRANKNEESDLQVSRSLKADGIPCPFPHGLAVLLGKAGRHAGCHSPQRAGL